VIQDLTALMGDYLAWLNDRTSLAEIAEIKDCFEITTPYLDRHNDYLQVYACRVNGGFVLTDDGYTLEDLEMSGCKVTGSAKQQDLLETTLNGFGVQANGNALEVEASVDNFPLKMHSLVQAMLAVNDLFYLTSPSTGTDIKLSYVEVGAWLDLSSIRYEKRATFKGRSGYEHRFDFVIPQSKTQPQRFLKAINRPNRDAAKSVAFSWVDTKEQRSADARVYAILNDSEKTIAEDVLDAMRSYEVQPVLWSARGEAERTLAA